MLVSSAGAAPGCAAVCAANGTAKMGSGDLRYWSFCSNQGFANTRVNDCVYDEQIPVDKNGYFTLVLSRPEDR